MKKIRFPAVLMLAFISVVDVIKSAKEFFGCKIVLLKQRHNNILDCESTAWS